MRLWLGGEVVKQCKPPTQPYPSFQNVRDRYGLFAREAKIGPIHAGPALSAPVHGGISEGDFLEDNHDGRFSTTLY